jgi:hypothetical protein
MVRPLEAESGCDLPRDQVDQRAGNEEGRHARGPFSLISTAVSAIEVKPADARPDHHAGAQRGSVGFGLPAGIAHRLLGGGHAIQDEVIDLAAVLRLHPVIGIEGAVVPSPSGISQA